MEGDNTLKQEYKEPRVSGLILKKPPFKYRVPLKECRHQVHPRCTGLHVPVESNEMCLLCKLYIEIEIANPELIEQIHFDLDRHGDSLRNYRDETKYIDY